MVESTGLLVSLVALLGCAALTGVAFDVSWMTGVPMTAVLGTAAKVAYTYIEKSEVVSLQTCFVGIKLAYTAFAAMHIKMSLFRSPNIPIQ